jgi:hypothetical protein
MDVLACAPVVVTWHPLSDSRIWWERYRLC